MDWAASELWNLLYLAATIFAFCMAYYSRHEQIQKMMAYLAITYPIGMLAHGTEAHALAFLALDVIGLTWALHVLMIDLKEPASRWCVFVFMMMLISYAQPDPGLIGLIAYNLLYLAQLAALCIYGIRYGIQARENPDHKRRRTDSYYRAFAACRLMPEA